MEKLNFDVEKYQSLTPDEKVETLSKIFFKYLDKGLITEDLYDEEIEGIYSMTIIKIHSLFVDENDPIDNGFKLKFFYDHSCWYNEEKNISLSDEEYWDLPKDFTIFDFFGYRNYSKYDTDGSIDRTKIGFKVFSRFKDFIRNQNEPAQAEKSKLNAPEKIALLEYLGIFKKLNTDGVSREDEYNIIHNLIGGSHANIKKYCLNRKNNNQSYRTECLITDKHREKAKEYYNSKTL